MKNWKRLLAGFSTATLLLTNVGVSTPLAVYAEEDPKTELTSENVTLKGTFPSSAELEVKSTDVEIEEQEVIAAYELSVKYTEVVLDEETGEPLKDDEGNEQTEEKEFTLNEDESVTVTISNEALTGLETVNVYCGDSRIDADLADGAVTFKTSSLGTFALTTDVKPLEDPTPVALDIASVTLEDNIKGDGTFVATFKDSNGDPITEAVIAAVKAENSTVTINWSSDGDEIADIAYIDGEPNRLMVVRDDCAQKTYTVTVKNGDQEVARASLKANYYSEIQNGSFDQNSLSSGWAMFNDASKSSSAVPGWYTTASDHKIELGRYAASNSAHGVYSDQFNSTVGSNYAELNANQASTLYQDVLTDSRTTLNWSLLHRARTSGNKSPATDKMYAVIMSTEDAEKAMEGVSEADHGVTKAILAMIRGVTANGAEQTYTLQTGTNAGEEVILSVWDISTTTTNSTGSTPYHATGTMNGVEYSSEETGWIQYTGSYRVPEGQYLTRFFFASNADVSSAEGNLLDDVQFDSKVNYTVEYYLWNADQNAYVLQNSDTESGRIRANRKVSAGNTGNYSSYKLVGTVQGATSAGADAAINKNNKNTYFYATENVHYLSLYYKPENENETNVTGTITWVGDSGVEDDVRPKTVIVKVYNGDEVVDTITVEPDDDSNWTYTSDDLPKKGEDGEVIQYTVKADAVNNYTVSMTGNNITYTYNPKTDINTTVSWNDNGDADGNRPSSINVKITGTDGSEKTITIDSTTDDWKKTVENLPQKDNSGNAITYTLTVDGTYPGYTFAVDNTTYTITGNYTAETVAIDLTTEWKDDNNRDGVRPSSYKVTINGTEYTIDADSKTLNLPKYKNGTAITYTVESITVGTVGTVGDYTSVVTSNGTNGFKVTNTHTSATTSVTTGITWVDGNNQDGKRPDKVTVTLKGTDGSTVTKTLTSTNNWKDVVFSDLPTYNNGQKITYTIDNVTITDYDVTITNNQITATHTVGKVNINLDNIWNDSNNQDGIRPNKVTVNIKNGDKIVKTVDLTEAGSWGDVIKNLPQYENGTEIKYTVELADSITGYTTEIISNDATHTYTIKNTHKAETVDFSSITGGWVDENNQDGIRPKTTTVTLYKNGQPTDYKVTIDENGKVTGSIGEQPKYENGTPINYTLVPTTQDGYTSKVTDDGKGNYTVTYTHDPEEISITVDGAWNDDNNRDDSRPENGTKLYLYADGEKTAYVVTLKDDGSIVGKFPSVPVYKEGEVGQKITYTIVPESVDEYDITEVDGNGAVKIVDGKATVTYNRAIDMVGFPIDPADWQDNNDQDGKRPGKVVVQLYRNGEPVEGQTVTINEDGTIEGKIDDQPVDEKDKVGVPYDYELRITTENGDEITEDNTGYSYEITKDEKTGKYTPVLRHAPAKRNITVTGGWDDANNQDGKRPSAASSSRRLPRLMLLANGKSTGRYVTLNENGEIENPEAFENVDVYANGEEIAYTLQFDDVADYSVEGAENQTIEIVNGKAVVTYQHTPETVKIGLDGIWDDHNNEDGKRVPVTVELVKNGVPTGKTVEIDKDGNVIGTFGEYDVYENGEKITYTFNTTLPNDYTAEVVKNEDGTYTITYKYTPERDDNSGSKSHDNGHREGGVGQINYYLVDKTTGQPLAGAKVSLYKSNGTLVGTYTTDANGYIGIKGAEASTYYFAEIQAPNGYALSSDRINFQLFGNESISVSQTNVALGVAANNTAAADQAALDAANAAAANAAAGAGDDQGAAGAGNGDAAAVSGATGDESNMMIYGAVAASAAAMLALWFAHSRKNIVR